MRRLTVLSAILGVLSAACGQSVSPTSPAATEGSLRRIVEDVSGGNVGVCLPTCQINGEITVSSSQGNLAATYTVTAPSLLVVGTQESVVAEDFGVTAFQMTLTGKLANRDLELFTLSVSPTIATVRVNFHAPPGGYYLAEGSAPPSFRMTSDSSCTSGQRLQTTIRLNLEHLGKTEIVDNHCIR